MTRPGGAGLLALLAAAPLQKRWTLHVGGSFGDVPRGSPFYRFVEALLHRGVTSGCGPGAFCPQASSAFLATAFTLTTFSP